MMIVLAYLLYVVGMLGCMNEAQDMSEETQLILYALFGTTTMIALGVASIKDALNVMQKRLKQ